MTAGHDRDARIVMGGIVPLVEVWRGRRVESVHEGAAAVVSADGRLVAHAGDPMMMAYLRSTAKPFQLLPLVESGAADHFKFTPRELAVMAASHSGRLEHVETVNAILARIGVDADALQCGAHAPYDDDARVALEHAGQQPTALHNNCSGKHAGMLAWCRYHDAPLADYLAPAHPLQRAIRKALAALADIDESAIELAIDGCSAPCFALPLAASARAFAQLTFPGDAGDAHAAAMARIGAAMALHADMVAGPGRFDTAIMQATAGRVVAKAGAEGYQGLALRDGALGVAIKIADGNGRAAAPTAIAILEQLGVLDDLPPGIHTLLEALRAPVVTNRRNIEVGHIQPVVALTRVRDATGDND
jgi:L-asparaginase II